MSCLGPDKYYAENYSRIIGALGIVENNGPNFGGWARMVTDLYYSLFIM